MDVNYINYGNNALRVLDSATDSASFLGANGEVVGSIIVLLIVLFCIGLLFVIGYLFIVKPLLSFGKK